MAASWIWISSRRCSSLRVFSATNAPSGVGNFQTVKVAIDALLGCAGRDGSRDSGIQDLRLLHLELGVVEHAGVPELTQLLELGELRLVVHARGRGRWCGGLLGGRLRLRLRLGLALLGPSVALPPGDPVRHGRG